MKHLGDLAYPDGLPRDTILLRRLVAVPTVLLNGNAYGALETQLASHHAFSGIEGGDALRQFFVLKLVEDLEAGAARACPSIKSPVPAGRGWVIVGRNRTFDWRLPILNEPLWAGHHYVLELTREPITRAVRKAVAASMTAMEKALPSLARLERNDILRRARPSCRADLLGALRSARWPAQRPALRSRGSVDPWRRSDSGSQRSIASSVSRRRRST